MENKGLRVLVLVLTSAMLSACAGPTTPFGALHAWTPGDLQKLSDSVQAKFFGVANPDVSITVHPDRQVLHDRSRPQISIFDAEGIPSTAVLKAYFDGYDISNKIFKDATYNLHPKARNLIVEFRNLRIPAGKEKSVLFTYQRDPTSEAKGMRWNFPECPFEEKMALTNFQTFNPPEEWIGWIEAAAETASINPALIAGLVAQESSFNPKAISWAKAIGLTQITPLADRELATVGSAWQRSKKIDSYPAPVIKAMIATDKLTDQHDYRLDPQYSLQAGAQYISYLRSYWASTDHETILSEKLSADPHAKSKVILASYNSGAYRVKKAILEKGTDFLLSDELKEARKYVSRTSSYCYHFATKEQSR